MNPDDDPEARIRALEQPLADNARASELGSTPYSAPGEAYLPPPLPPMPPPVQGPPYQQPGYGAQQGYGAPWSPQPPRRSSGAGIPWVIFVIVAVVFMAIAGAVGFFVMQRSTSSIPSFPGVTIPSISVPSMPGISTIPPAPTAAPPGESIGVSGMSQNKTLECNDNYVTVSGMGNTVTITGHCTTVVVSGMQNNVTLDSSDEIKASGSNNVVTYHSGSPDIQNGGNNLVQQG